MAAALPRPPLVKKVRNPLKNLQKGLAMARGMCYNISRLRTRALWFLVP